MSYIKVLGTTASYLLAIGITALYTALAVFEIITAQNNSPHNTDLNGYGIDAYAFTVTKSVINSFISFFMIVCTFWGLCFAFKGVVTGDSDLGVEGSLGSLFGTIVTFYVGSFISFDVNIWGLVIYFNFQDHNIEAYKHVFYAEMIASFVLIGIVGFSMILSCCAPCCGLLMSSESDRKPNFSAV